MTIMEILYNAQMNLVVNSKLPFAFPIGREQLRNAIILLEKGYGPEEDVGKLLEENVVENIPDKS